MPPIGELIRRDGDAGRGREVFFRTGTNSCGGCHRVQGRGQWVGPDLSTIGVKYGRDELIRSILNPSAAIGYNFRSVVAAMADGRVITGLLVEETADRLVLKTADGERITLPTGSIEERRTSDVSLMPEGLAQTMTDQELVDLLVYLTTLKQPVSIVGQYHVVGPLAQTGDAPRINPAAAVDLDATLDDGGGRKLSWRRINANAEGRVDLSTLASADAKPGASIYAYMPISSPTTQKATARPRHPGRRRGLAQRQAGGTHRWQGQGRAAHRHGRPGPGPGSLLIRVTPEGPVSLVTTFVADQPVGFTNK